MTKHGFMTPKAIGNRIKAKGLQKLRWYCQMCQKQCRDENGMKCHMASEGHLRMMRVFSESSGRIISDYSEAFLNGYLKTLSHRHGTKRISANRVYQEYIGDKDHIHMNATAWSSLSALCKYLGKEGKCIVEETEKGWFVHWIDRDPKTLERQAQLESRQRSDLDDEERARLLIASQIAAGSSSLEEDNEECLEENKLERSENMPKIGISLNVNLGDKSRGILGKLGSSVFSVEDEAVAPNDKTIRNEKAVPIIQQIRQEDERRRERELDSMDRRERLDYWLQEGLCVKIINKVVGVGKYYKQKGAVVRVLDRYVADVEVSGLAVLRLDQDDLETVLPKAGNRVMIVNGRGRGARALLLAINEEGFNCDVRVDEGILAGRELRGVAYEDVCKLMRE